MNFQWIPSLLIILLVDTEMVRCILNGNTTVGDNFKYYVISWCRLSLFTCGGVIIDDFHILTAGHCVMNSTPEEHFVYAGVTDLTDDDPIIREVKTIHSHPNYQPRFEPTVRQMMEQTVYHAENDIAVLTLTDRLPLDGKMAAIPLPIGKVSACQVIENCEFPGFGQSTPDSSMALQLSWTNVIAYGSALCRILDTPVRENEFCGIDPRGMTTLLKGDSGGGLVCNGILVGIASSSRSDPQYSTVYASVYDFLSFINEVRRLDRDDTEPESDSRKKVKKRRRCH